MNRTALPRVSAMTYGRLPYAALLAHTAVLPQHTTAAERGDEWMAEYGCTPNCVMDHTQPDSNPGWHQGPEATMPSPGQYGTNLPGEEPEPMIAARVTTVNESPEVFGVTSKLWVDLPGDTLELPVAEVDQFIAGLEAFLPQLRALRAQLAEVAKSDVPRNAEAVAHWYAEHDARIARERAEIAANQEAR